MPGDREPREGTPLDGDSKTLGNLLLGIADILSFNQKACRQGRGNRADSPLIKACAIIGFPFIVASFGEQDLHVVYSVWVCHLLLMIVMAINRNKLRKQYGPMHSRFVGWSAPEWLGFPASISKLLLEPALWIAIGIGISELGFRGLGNFYCVGAVCLIPEALVIMQRDDTLTTDAVDARLEALDRVAEVQDRLGG
jgi:hypothetical protein